MYKENRAEVAQLFPSRDTSGDDLLALITRIENENPKVAAAALDTEVSLVLGRPPRASETDRRAKGSTTNVRRPASSTFGWYQSIVAQIPPLLDHEKTVEAAKVIEVGLFAQLRLDDDELIPPPLRRDLQHLADEGDRAFELLTLANLRLVFHWCKGVATSVGEDWVQDAFQVGCIGLIRGIQGWDYMRGYHISTFVSWHIRQQIQRWRMNETSTIRVPVHVWERLEGGSEEAVSDVMLDAAKRALNMTYLDDRSSNVLQCLESAETAESLDSVVLAIDRRRGVDAILATLDDRSETVIRLRYGLGNNGDELTLQAIGEIYGVTRERIRQIEMKAMKAITRRALDGVLIQLL